MCALLGGLLLLCSTAPAFDTVVIDAGHGGKDPGARWNGLLEKTLALDMAKRLETALRERGFKTVMTRSADTYVELSERAAIANRHPGAIFVSVHFDASRDTSAKGFTTHYRSKRARLLAASVQRTLNKQVSGRSREIDWQDLKVLRETKGTAVLVECGFISNVHEAANCKNPQHLQTIAEAISVGIAAVRRQL
jgi:N-acetylmuramoyl-L-alanine amidase